MMKKKLVEFKGFTLMVKCFHNCTVFSVREFLFGSLRFIPHAHILSPRGEPAHDYKLFLPT